MGSRTQNQGLRQFERFFVQRASRQPKGEVLGTLGCYRSLLLAVCFLGLVTMGSNSVAWSRDVDADKMLKGPKIS